MRVPENLTKIHLLRHGEVFNPEKIIYERLDGYHLSDRGKQMAEQVAQYISNHQELKNIVKIYCSPLDRTIETATPVAKSLGLEIVKDERLLESKHLLAGKNPHKHISNLLKSGKIIQLLKLVKNPSKPSWGEPYVEVVQRMESLIKDILKKHQGKHVLIVSHQNPIWVTRLFFEEKQLRHNPQKRVCDLASITTLAFNKNADVPSKIIYHLPARDI